jgi:hypothetical protein
VIVLGGILLLLTAAAAAAFVIDRSLSSPAWYVEPDFERQWAELLETAPAPPPFVRMASYDPEGLRKGRRGVVISRTFPVGEAEGVPPASEETSWEPPVRLYPGLYRDRSDYRGAIPLALDPWLVIRKTGDPPLALERALDGAGGEGVLIFPGAESEAEAAWIAQLLQRSPGGFPPEKQVWDEAKQSLVYGNRRFQQGAFTYTWFDAWIRLLQDEPAWLYAPLSGTRGLNSYDRGRLNASVFPIPGDWNTYGLQADLLWAVPGGLEEQETLLEETRAWLSSAEIQGLLAGLLGWIPAEPGTVPYDTLARQAQVAWFSSSFVWQTR